MFPSARSEVDILLNNVACSNTDQTLLSCRHDGVGNHDCLHDEDVVIYCAASNEDTFTTITVRETPEIDEIEGKYAV